MKKFMFYLMVLNTFVASIVMIVVLAMGSSALPPLVLALRGVLIVGSVVLVVKRYVSWVRRGEIAAYYAAEAAVAVFNLVYLAMFSPVDVSFFEFAITGTLVTPVLNGMLMLLLFKAHSRYAVIENADEPAGMALPAAVSGHAVKQS